MVVPAGNAPASSGYQPGALLLSYGTVVNCGFMPNRFAGRNTKFNFAIGRIRMREKAYSSCEREVGFDSEQWISWDYLSLRVELAEGVGNAPTRV